MFLRERASGSDEEADAIVVVRERRGANRLDQRHAEDGDEDGKRFQYCHSHKETGLPGRETPPLERSPVARASQSGGGTVTAAER